MVLTTTSYYKTYFRADDYGKVVFQEELPVPVFNNQELSPSTGDLDSSSVNLYLCFHIIRANKTIIWTDLILHQQEKFK